MDHFVFLFAKTPAGRNEQRKFIGDSLRVSAIAFLAGPLLDMLRATSDDAVFSPIGAATSLVLGTAMLIFGAYLMGQIEALD